jgi:hypothetical protein
MSGLPWPAANSVVGKRIEVDPAALPSALFVVDGPERRAVVSVGESGGRLHGSFGASLGDEHDVP